MINGQVGSRSETLCLAQELVLPILFLICFLFKKKSVVVTFSGINMVLFTNREFFRSAVLVVVYIEENSMNPMSLLGYLLIFLFVAIGNAAIYARMKEWRRNRLKSLDNEFKDLEQSYAKLQNDIREAQSRENQIKAELLDSKKTSIRESENQENGKNSKKGKKAKTVLDILKEMELVDNEKLEKANHYLERSDNAGLKMEDVLVLLGLVTSDQLKKAQAALRRSE